MSDDLAVWLRAQLAERAEKARDAHNDNCRAHTEDPTGLVLHSDRCDCGLPELVLAEVAAKRSIVAAYEHKTESMARYPNPGNASGLVSLTVVLRHLASVYASRPGYREEWRP